MMEFWHDMRKFHKGKDEKGNDRFAIPLSLDEDGMAGRECHQENCQPKYFKIVSVSHTNEGQESPPQEKDPVEYLYCPYCEHQDGFQQFITNSQLEWIQSMMFRDVAKTIQDMFKNTFQPNTSSNRGLIKVTLQYKPGSLPSVRHYAEKELKRSLKCDNCGRGYAVYGIAMYCPWCGTGNLSIHLDRSIEIIRSLIDFYGNIVGQAGKEAGYHLLGNGLEDCVSLFEGFLKIIYSEKLSRRFAQEECVEKKKKIGNSFQQPVKAERIFKTDLGIEIFKDITIEDQDFLNYQFAKRHVITHNLGLVDEKFQDRVKSWQGVGQEVPLDSTEIKRVLDIIRRLIKSVIDV